MTHTYPTDPGPLWVQRKIAMLRHKAETAPKLILQSTPLGRAGEMPFFDAFFKAVAAVRAAEMEGK